MYPKKTEYFSKILTLNYVLQKHKDEDDLSEYTLRFEQFEEAIHDLVKKKDNIRIQTHGKYVDWSYTYIIKNTTNVFIDVLYVNYRYFRYLSGVILEAKKVLSEELTAIQKQIDGNDIMFQNFTEHMTKIKEAIKKVSVFGNCISVAPDFSFLKFSYFFTVHLFI